MHIWGRDPQTKTIPPSKKKHGKNHKPRGHQKIGHIMCPSRMSGAYKSKPVSGSVAWWRFTPFLLVCMREQKANLVSQPKVESPCVSYRAPRNQPTKAWNLSSFDLLEPIFFNPCGARHDSSDGQTLGKLDLVESKPKLNTKPSSQIKTSSSGVPRNQKN